ncbi:(2Fe-2S)-binding protein [Streptomyces gobiensis]|uniref:(2Fe-2S)-binding protein n=1 Tax=Streptomyces gobiensis TaxID=2875706 RepID=UPI001E613D26|nr:(2Fe-2S)-binding protein [Streptomyces gobiensis]UGY94564.1 (2Fe-2S)-binding protein [Streptomyces gobiensis]
MDVSETASPGGFFTLRTQAPVTTGAVPLARVYAGDTGPLWARIEEVAARLNSVETRVAASIAFLGLASRLWSIALAPTVLRGWTPDLSPERLHWDPARTAPDDLWLPEPRPLPVAAEPAERIRDVVHGRHLVPLIAATRQVAPVSERLLWGNAASALGGALGQLYRWCHQHGQRSAAGQAQRITSALLAHPDLRTTGTLTGTRFRRHTCCLYYRVPGGGLCGDCVFTRAPRRRTPGPPSS